MKTLLICPDERPALAAFARSQPLAALPLLGKPLLEHWLEHVARLGARHVRVLAADRPHALRELTGDGARWGLHVEVLPEMRELSPAEARAKYQGPTRDGWLAKPWDVALLDHFPGHPQYPLFTRFADYFVALQARLCRVVGNERIGLRELQPGIWAGCHTRISRRAQFHPPCWIGDHVSIGPQAIIGPMTILEDRVCVDRNAWIAHSAIGPDTFVGEWVEVKNSVAWGDTLVNWRTGSSVQVPDEYLLSPLAPAAPGRPRLTHWLGRLAAMLLMELTMPFGMYAAIRAKLRGEAPFRERTAVRPRLPARPGVPDQIVYYEMASGNRWLRRWPQLWSVACGDFAWVGNRPLAPDQEQQLTNDFERLWLEAPLGLISLADAEGSFDTLDDHARAHASYYAAARNRHLDHAILTRFARGLLRRAVAKGTQELSTNLPAPLPEQRRLT